MIGEATIYSCSGWFGSGYARTCQAFSDSLHPGHGAILGPWNHTARLATTAAQRAFDHDGEARGSSITARGADQGIGSGAMETSTSPWSEPAEVGWHLAAAATTQSYYLSADRQLRPDAPVRQRCRQYVVGSPERAALSPRRCKWASGEDTFATRPQGPGCQAA